MKKKKRKLKGTRLERLLIVLTFALVLLSPVASVYAKSNLTKVNYQVEVAKEKISDEEKNNESLQMKINELASFENLETVAKQMGLSYTSNSIKTLE